MQWPAIGRRFRRSAIASLTTALIAGGWPTGPAYAEALQATTTKISISPTRPQLNDEVTVTLTVSGPAPYAVPDSAGSLVTGKIAAGDSHTCAIAPNGAARCWGLNAQSQLGSYFEPETTSSPFLVPAVDGTTNAAITLAAGHAFSCALIDDGGVTCWGANSSGQLGTGIVQYMGYGENTLGFGVGGITAKAIAAGFAHACALTDNGSVMCWGSNSSGQIGDGTFENRAIPKTVAGIGAAKAVAAGGEHTCAITVEGAVMCWGANTWGQVGNGVSSLTVMNPTMVPGIGETGQPKATEIATRWNHTCALLDNGGIKCWGSNAEGQIGDGTTNAVANPLPVDVLGLGGPGQLTAAAIAVGDGHTCAIIEGGTVRCWGKTGLDQPEDGTATPGVPSDVPVVGSTGERAATAIAAGGGHTCVLTTGGHAICWGISDSGQLGRSTSDRSPGFVKTGTAKFNIELVDHYKDSSFFGKTDVVGNVAKATFVVNNLGLNELTGYFSSSAETLDESSAHLRFLVPGTAGNDNLSGTNLPDVLIGLGGDDWIEGYGGDDRLYGNSGDDTIYGNSGNDRIYGGAGADGLTGGAGDDFISGGAGRDVIEGSGGADVIFGGRGPDILEGNFGADRFVFLNAGESPPRAPDTIVDMNFSQGDQIDLRWFDINPKKKGIQQFRYWIVTRPFTGRPGELRFNRKKFRYEGDTNGDRRADFAIKILEFK